MEVAVYGLGKLGLPIAQTIARGGVKVTGVDRALTPELISENKDVIELSPFLEFSPTPMPADISLIVVPTPSTISGSFEMKYVGEAIAQVKQANKDHKSIAVVVSTTSPGQMQYLSDVTKNERFKLVYAPTFIALGSVMRDLTNPDLQLIGGDDVNAMEEVERCFDHWFTAKHVHRGSFTEVELLKLAVNCYLGTKISFANSMGEVFKAFGVNPTVLRTIGFDHRIGRDLLMPGAPFGGPCLPRDNRAMREAARESELALPISVATDSINNALFNEILVKTVKAATNPVSRLGILGTSYKYGTTVTDGSVAEYVTANNLFFVDILQYDVALGGDVDLVLAADVILVTQPEYEWYLNTVDENKNKIVRIW